MKSLDNKADDPISREELVSRLENAKRNWERAKSPEGLPMYDPSGRYFDPWTDNYEERFNGQK